MIIANQATSGVVVDTWTYDPYADVASATATVAGLPIFETHYVRDDLVLVLVQAHRNRESLGSK